MDKSKILVIIGLLLLLVALAVRINLFPIMIASDTVKGSSLIILANTAFILALLTKK